MTLLASTNEKWINYVYRKGIEVLEQIVTKDEKKEKEEPYFGHAGRIQPIGENQILHNEENEPLFLRNLEEIEGNVALPLFWRSPLFRTIVSISPNGSEGEWPEKWNIQSESEHSSYYLGLKLVTDSVIQLGWIEIEINATNGQISIVDRGLL